MQIENYPLQGGQHPETAILANMLAHAGIVAPHTSAPYSEEMLLGLAGGIGIGYILWEFKSRHAPVLELGMRSHWHYPVRFIEGLAQRLRLSLAVHETRGMRAARDHLVQALDANQPALVWVDLAGLPYLYLPEQMRGVQGSTVGVIGIEGKLVYLDDRGAVPFAVTADELAAARATIPSYRNRLVTLEGAGGVDLAAAIRAGLHDCATQLSAGSESFALPALRKWARLITDARQAKGWKRLFADRRGLYPVLRTIYEQTVAQGIRGGSLRDLYARFLREAAPVVNLPALNEVAEQYRWLALRWSNLGETALPTASPPLRRTKELLSRRAMLLALGGNAEQDELRAIGHELSAIQAACDTDFPLTSAATALLLEQ
ncbi:MAG: DUF4872 domain-containing protein, partial [Caldilineaceae bacterium]|nr:DUF4872 domain-containing protein [Caldilineaceae bacterium]